MASTKVFQAHFVTEMAYIYFSQLDPKLESKFSSVTIIIKVQIYCSNRK